MADIASLAIGVAILDGDDEIVGQQRRQNIDLPLLVRFRPFQFHGTDVGGVRFIFNLYLAPPEGSQILRASRETERQRRGSACFYVAQFGPCRKFLVWAEGVAVPFAEYGT